MKRTVYLLLFLGILAVAAGCNRQESVFYSGVESGWLNSGLFKSDSGVPMTVVGNEGNLDVTTARRVLLQYQTHSLMSSGKVDIDVLGIWDAGIIDPEPAVTLPDTPSGSPLQVTDAWFSANYLNILASYPCENPSGHSTSVSYSVDTRAITIQLRHEGSTGSKSNDVFLSIPMEASVNAYRERQGALANFPVDVLLQWSWYESKDGPLKLYGRTGSYKPES